MSAWTQADYIKAWNFATVKHHGQRYGGPDPSLQIDYINHIGSVAMELIHAFQHHPDINQSLAIQCALLHDTIEDTNTTYEEVKSEFGEAVADGVCALTKNESLEPKSARMTDSLARIQCQPKEIWMVKLADRITNLYHPPYYWDQDKTDEYKLESIEIYTALKDASDVLSQRLKAMLTDYGQRREALFPNSITSG